MNKIIRISAAVSRVSNRPCQRPPAQTRRSSMVRVWTSEPTTGRLVSPGALADYVHFLDDCPCIGDEARRLAGVLLPSATVFLLLLCNDAVLGPWVDGRAASLFTGGVIAVLVIMSLILTASVLLPEQTDETIILSILGGGVLLAIIAAVATEASGKQTRGARPPTATRGASHRFPNWSPLASRSRASSGWTCCASTS